VGFDVRRALRGRVTTAHGRERGQGENVRVDETGRAASRRARDSVHRGRRTRAGCSSVADEQRRPPSCRMGPPSSSPASSPSPPLQPWGSPHRSPHRFHWRRSSRRELGRPCAAPTCRAKRVVQLRSRAHRRSLRCRYLRSGRKSLPRSPRGRARGAWASRARCRGPAPLRGDFKRGERASSASRAAHARLLRRLQSESRGKCGKSDKRFLC